MSKKNNLSVCILALDEAQHIEMCLKSIRQWAQEIIVGVDDKTTDETFKIASKYSQKVFKLPHKDNFHINKQTVLDKARSPWILWLDGDEEIDRDLRFEIEKEVEKKYNSFNGYWIPRKNIIFGKWIQHTGWHPDHQLRLFKKGKIKFPCKSVHENPEIKGSTAHLKNHIIHYNYQTVSQFIERMNRYTSVDAQNFVKKVKPPYYLHFIARPIDEFIKRFLFCKGFKDGLHGLALSLLQAAYELVVVAKAWQIKDFPEENPPEFIKKVENQSKKIIKTWFWWKKQIQIDKAGNFIVTYYLKILRKLGF